MGIIPTGGFGSRRWALDDADIAVEGVAKFILRNRTGWYASVADNLQSFLGAITTVQNDQGGDIEIRNLPSTHDAGFAIGIHRAS